MKTLYNIFGINIPRRTILKSYGIRCDKRVVVISKHRKTYRGSVEYRLSLGDHYQLNVRFYENELTTIYLYHNGCEVESNRGGAPINWTVEKWNKLFDKASNINKLMDKI